MSYALKNNEMMGVLNNPNNILVLEDILNENHKILGNFKHKTILGEKLKKGEIIETAHNVKSLVDSFLEIKDVKMPNISTKNITILDVKMFSLIYGSFASMIFLLGLPGNFYGFMGILNLAVFASQKLESKDRGRYYPLFNNIEISGSYLNKKVFPSLFAHEYSHAALHQKEILPSFFNKEFLAFNEGFCRSVQRQISLQYSEEFKDPSFNYTMNQYIVMELGAAYKMLCEKHKKPYFVNFAKETGDLNHHAIGNAVFSIIEKSEKDLCRKIMKREPTELHRSLQKIRAHLK